MCATWYAGFVVFALCAMVVVIVSPFVVCDPLNVRGSPTIDTEQALVVKGPNFEHVVATFSSLAKYTYLLSAARSSPIVMYCSIGGHVPQEPVVSRTSGALFERRLIEKHLAQNGGRCPVTNEPLTTADLLAVQSGANIGPRSCGSASIPALLSSLHAEWDALMLEQFSLRQQLAQAEQDLSLAAYKHDAACRVIARLVRERDELTAKAQSGGGGGFSGTAAPSAAAGTPQQQQAAAAEQVIAETQSALPAPVLGDIDSTKTRLQTMRRRSEYLRRATVDKEQVSRFIEIHDYCPPHASVSGSAVGVLCVAAQQLSGGRAVYAGGADGKISVYDVTRGAVAGSMLGHTKATRHLIVQDSKDMVISGSDDGTARIWRLDNGLFRCSSVVKGHAGPVSGIALLPSGPYLLTTGADGSVRFSDVETGGMILSKKPPETALGIACSALHPDGFMIATSTSAAVHLWDVRRMQINMALPLPDHGNVTSLSFSEDALTLAVGTSKGVVQLCDLRTVANTAPLLLNMTEGADAGQPQHHAMLAQSGGVRRVSFDPSGQFLAAAAANVVKIWAKSDVSLLTRIASHLEPVTDVAWGPDASWLVTSSLDRRVKLFGTGSE